MSAMVVTMSWSKYVAMLYDWKKVIIRDADLYKRSTYEYVYALYF